MSEKTKPQKGPIYNWGIVWYDPHGTPIILFGKSFVETENSFYDLIGSPTKKKHEEAQIAYDLRILK